jgi:hypothetical protein
MDFQCKISLAVSVVVWKWDNVFKRAFILRFCKEKLFKCESFQRFILITYYLVLI